jgi:hypothetical protein
MFDMPYRKLFIVSCAGADGYGLDAVSEPIAGNGVGAEAAGDTGPGRVCADGVGGICFGVPLDLNGRVTQLKTAGAAKVLAVQ